MGDEYLPQNQTTNEKISVNEGIIEFDSLETHYKQTKEKLRFHESLIYSMTDTSPLAFYVVDNRTDEILYFNHRFCEIWGITHLEEAMRRDELKNQDIVPYCLPLVKNVPAFLESCKPLQNEEVRFTVEDEIQFVDGRRIRRVSSQIRGELDRYFGRLYIFEDATDRKRLDDELRKITERIINYQKALLELAKMDNADLELTLKRVTEVDSKTLGVERISVWLFNEDHSEIICKDVYNMSEKIHQNGLRLKAKDYSLYFQALEESRTLAASDALTDPRTSEYTEGYLKPFGITSMMDVPVRLHGKVVGVVCHEHTGPMREWTAEEQDFAASIADMVSLALEASERNRIEEALRKGEERYRALYEDNPSMYFTVDTEGKVLSVNLFGAEQLGYKAHELVGQSVLMIFHPDDREGVLKQMRVCLQNPNQIFQWEFRKIRKDGSILWVKEAARAIQGAEGGAVVLISCEDITERKQMEEALQKAKYDLEIKVEQRTSELRKSNEQLLAEISDRKRTEEDLNKRNKDLETINAVTQAVHQSFDLEEIYKVALDMITSIENVDMAMVYLVDKDRKEAVLQAHRNVPEDYLRRAERIPYPRGITWKLINTGKMLYVEDIQKDTDMGPAGRDLGHHSVLGIPIFLEKEVIGVIWFLSYKERKFDEREVNLLSAIGDQIAIAIAKAKLYRELSKKNRYETIISTATRSVHQTINLQDVLENAVEAMSKNIDGADNVSIYLVEGAEADSTGSSQAVIKSYRGYSEAFIGKVRRIPYPKGFTWKTIIEGKPLYCPDVDQDTVIGPAGREVGTKSYASMPIQFEGKTIGCININSLEKDAFDEEELKLLEIVARQIEIAITNARQAELLYQAKEGLELRVLERTQELSEINEELRKEIAERNRVEEEIRQTQSFLNSVVENIPDMIFVKDAKDLRFVRFNKAGEELLGYSRGNLIGKTDYDFFLKEEADFFTSKDREVLESAKLHDIPEEPIHTRNKGRRILHTKKIPIFNADGKPRYLLGISEDITERKRVEKQIKSSLEEKEVLLKEVHHRVKNNLQIISSLLDLQSEYVKDKKTRELFHETQNRVRAIAHIHERFYQSEDLARIDFAEYIRHLGNYLFQSYGVDSNFIKLKVNVQDVVLDVNTAIPCGLIINELISNSLKHAFRKRKKGEIRIDLHSDIKRSDSHRHRLYTMAVRDNGVGFPKDLDFRNAESLGLQLVNALTNQIGGSIGLNRRYGTAFKITFSNQL